MTLRSLATQFGQSHSTWGNQPDTDSSMIRVAVDETLMVTLTVNGCCTSLNVAPRVTLADALRDHLGLTGTHLGCEHGVCGMCTVLVDGDAARACLLLTCQLEGAEIITVEGLGKPNDLHPLQESFGRNHGLQCGFCTPGMLMSAYDLLCHEPRVQPEALPKQMSGILCRCTGYRQIVNAIAEVASTYPEGVPKPKNCTNSVLLPRSVVDGRSFVESEHPAVIDGTRMNIRLPETSPTVVVEVDSKIDATPEMIWAVMNDTERLARCLPGAELTADFGNDRYKGRAKVSLGPIRLSFVGDVHIVQRDPDQHTLRVLSQGADVGGGTVQADIRLHVESHGSGSLLHADAQLYMSGRIAQFGRSLAGDVSRDMFEQFAVAVAAAARGEKPVIAKAPSGFAMLLKLVASRTRAAFSRISGRD